MTERIESKVREVYGRLWSYVLPHKLIGFIAVLGMAATAVIAVLQRDQALLTTAATWEASVVGLVSSDNLGLIPDAARNLVDAFIDAYQLAQIR